MKELEELIRRVVVVVVVVFEELQGEGVVAGLCAGWAGGEVLRVSGGKKVEGQKR